jgi:glutamate-1-semialdehyde 2,1-aminomutase
MRNMIHPNGIDHDAVTRIVEFNDIEALEAALSQHDVACVLTEPLMTNFGIIPVDDGFHRALREITRRTGTVLIIDETIRSQAGRAAIRSSTVWSPISLSQARRSQAVFQRASLD